MVISTDIDGCVSAVLLAEYANKHFSIPSEIIGTYDAEKITANAPSISLSDVFDGLWVDLDVQFPRVSHNIAHVGQHLLLTDVNIDSFNPNAFFGINQIREKYPFSTAFFLFYGLFDEAEFPVFQDQHSLAQSCLFHCDVTFMLVRRYKQNCENWIERLFPLTVPRSVKLLMSGLYETTGLEFHSSMFHQLQSALCKKIEGSGGFNTKWDDLNASTTVKGKSPSETFENIREIIFCAQDFFHVTPNFSCAVDGRVIWQGKREFPFWEKVELQNAVSHAWINARTVSVTYENN